MVRPRWGGICNSQFGLSHGELAGGGRASALGAAGGPLRRHRAASAADRGTRGAKRVQKSAEECRGVQKREREWS